MVPTPGVGQLDSPAAGWPVVHQLPLPQERAEPGTTCIPESPPCAGVCVAPYSRRPASSSWTIQPRLGAPFTAPISIWRLRAPTPHVVQLGVQLPFGRSPFVMRLGIGAPFRVPVLRRPASCSWAPQLQFVCDHCALAAN
eukprot:2083588-Alexandrium_andersonii.AAC.1